MKLGIKATQIVGGGGLAHLRKLLEHRPETVSPDSIIVFLSEKQRGMLDDLSLQCRLKYYRFPAINDLCRIVWELCALPLIIRREKIDLLFEPGNLGLIFSTVKRVMLIHNVAPFDRAYIKMETIRQKIRLTILSALTIISARRASGVIFLTEFSRNMLSDKLRLAKDIQPVINHGAEHFTSIDVSPGPVREPFIFCASHIYRYKNLESLIEAFAIIKSQHAGPLKLLIAGQNYDQEYSDKLERIIHQRSLVGEVKFVGNLNQDSLRWHYQKCELFIFPSFLESFSIILVEAMRESACVLASDIGVLREVGGPGAAYFPPRDFQLLAELALEFLNDEQKRQAMKDRARRRSLDFDWRKMAEESFAFFEKLCPAERRNTRQTLTLKRRRETAAEQPEVAVQMKNRVFESAPNRIAERMSDDVHRARHNAARIATEKEN